MTSSPWYEVTSKREGSFSEMSAFRGRLNGSTPILELINLSMSSTLVTMHCDQINKETYKEPQRTLNFVSIITLFKTVSNENIETL